MEYYSAIQENEIISFSGKWVGQEIMLSEISQIEKDSYHMFSYMQNLDLRKMT
jgi:hypothetical protein